MKDIAASSLKIQNNRLLLLDQTKLPGTEHWIDASELDTLCEAILSLRVRGAPMIGLSASLFVALKAETLNADELHNLCDLLQATRPTAVNLSNNLGLIRQAIAKGPAAVAQQALDLFNQDVALCLQMAEFGNTLIRSGDKVLTHCNTGSLATAGIGTAIGVIRHAHQSGKQIQVWVDETRPLLQGGRLTAWEMDKLKIPYHLITDSTAGFLMQSGEVDSVWVGADRIAMNGDVANKVGTYSLAVLAHYHQIPFYVVAPTTTLDLNCASGRYIPIEQRAASEIKGVSGSFGHCSWAPTSALVYNPAFDVTPAKLISGWIFDTGVYRQSDIADGVLPSLIAG